MSPIAKKQSMRYPNESPAFDFPMEESTMSPIAKKQSVRYPNESPAFDQLEINNNNNNRRQLEDAQAAYYLGAYCSETGGSIHLGLFTEESCSQFADANMGATTYKTLTGSALPYSDTTLIGTECMSCKEPQEVNQNGENQNNKFAIVTAKKQSKRTRLNTEDEQMSSELVIPKMQSSPLISLKDPIKMSSTEVSLFSFIRTSPGTENSGVFQFMRIVTTCQYLKHQGILPRFNDICPFNAKNVSRYTLLESPQFQRLVDAIHEVTSPVMVVVTSMNRLGVSYDSIQGALDRLTNNRSNVKVVCLDSFGINNSDHARDLSEYYESISKIECNHIDAGRGMNVSSHHMRERNTYFEYAAQLKSEWNSGADLPTYIHEACVVGSQLPRKSLTNRQWIKQSLIDMVNGEDVENIVKNYPFKCKDSPKQRYVAIYMRTSPESRPLTISDDILPKDQLSKCMAFYYLNNEISSRKLLIFNDVAKYRMSLTAGYVNLISRIVLGEVSNVIVKCTNRISSNYEKSMMFLEICRQFHVEIHFVANIGLNYAEVIRRDSQRVCTRQAILKKLTTSTKEKLEAANETKTNSVVKKFFTLCLQKLASQRMMVIDYELDLEIDADDRFDD